MPRAKTKEQLMNAGGENFAKLFSLIDSMTGRQRNASFNFEDRDKNVRDVLVHLYEWHRLLLTWVEANTAGGAANFLPDSYTWKTYPKMNVGFWEKHRNTSLDESITLVNASHADVMKLIGAFSDEELFTKKYFPWTGTTSLGSYCVSAAPSHYDWATKKIKQHLKSLE